MCMSLDISNCFHSAPYTYTYLHVQTLTCAHTNTYTYTCTLQTLYTCTIDMYTTWKWTKGITKCHFKWECRTWHSPVNSGGLSDSVRTCTFWLIFCWLFHSSGGLKIVCRKLIEMLMILVKSNANEFSLVKIQLILPIRKDIPKH